MGSFSLPITLIFLALATLTALFLWVRQREQIEVENSGDSFRSAGTAGAADDDQSTAVVVTSEHGQLLHVNHLLCDWMHMNGDQPTLDEIVRIVQPVDHLMGLLHVESRSSFQLGQRWVDASSHRVPAPDGQRMVVVMREMMMDAQSSAPQQAAAASGGGMDVSRMMRVINDIGETVNASMGMETALQVLLEVVNKALPSDAGEIALWEPERDYLQQRGWIGDTRYLLLVASRGGGYEMGDGIAGWMAETKRPFLLTGRQRVGTDLLIKDSTYKCAIGVPLLLNDEFIGTLTFFSNDIAHYDQSDVAFLQAISKAVATTIRNAQLYTKQEERIENIASLQQIAEQPKNDGQTQPIYLLLNERMANLMDAEMCGVFLFDDDLDVLIPQLPFYGLPDHVVSSISLPLTPNTIPRDIWENQPFWVSNDVQDEPLVQELSLQSLVDLTGLKNTAFFPLQIAGDRIGVMAISNKRGMGGFTPTDLQNLRVLSSQAAIVVENVRLYERERRIDAELGGLQEMTHAIGVLSHEDSFYGEITQRIARLMQSEMCGILIYDKAEEALTSRLPFHGVPDEMVTDYQIELASGSIIEQMWHEEDYWFSNRVLADPVVFAAKLDNMAEQLGILKTLIAPMEIGGRRIGVVQVSNPLDGSDYSPNEARFLRIFATQAASIIENQRLQQVVQEQTSQSEQMRHVAAMAGAGVGSASGFSDILAEVANLMSSDKVYVNLVDNSANALITYPRYTYGMDEITEPFIQNLADPGYHMTPARSGRSFISNNVTDDQSVLSGYRRVVERFGIEQSLVVPLSIGERLIGELGVANRARPYTDEDATMLSALATQFALSIERQELLSNTDDSLRHRVEELDSVARVSNELMLTVDFDNILTLISKEAAQTTGADGCSVLLLRPRDDWFDANTPELERRIGSMENVTEVASIEAEAILRETDPALVVDYADSSHKPLPSDAKSALVAPILYLEHVVGALHVYSMTENTFDDRASGFLMTLASKAALGYQNAALFEEQESRNKRLRQRVAQLQRIFELGQMMQTNTDPAILLDAIAYSIQQSIGFDTVLVLLDQENDGVLRRIAQAGMPLDSFQIMQGRTITVEQFESMLLDDYRMGAESYFFPIGAVDKWYQEGFEVLSTAYDNNRSVDPRSKDHWHDGDMLVVRVTGQDGDVLGAFVLDRPYTNMRPDQQMIDVLEIFSHQASAMIENTRLFIDSNRSAQQEAQLNDMLEAISGTLDLGEIAETLANGVREFIQFDRMTLVLADARDPVFDYLSVSVRENMMMDVRSEQRESLQRTTLGRSYEEREEYYYDADNREQIRHYYDLREWYDQGEKSTLVLPLVAGGVPLGALHFGSDKAGELAKRPNRRLLSRIVQLVASTMQNARLFNQAVTLQVLNRSVVESIQQGIVVLDEQAQVLSINEFMRNNYGWSESEARNRHLFDYRPELEAILKDEIDVVLSDGLPREKLGQTSPTDFDHVLVRNFYIYPLRSHDVVQGAVVLVEDVTERAKLEEAIESRANQLAALTEVSTRITASLERNEVIDLAMDEMGWIIPFNTMTMWRRNGSYMVLEGYSGFTLADADSDIRIRISEDERIQQLVDSQRVFSLSDVEFLPDHGLPGEQGIYSWMGVPLVNQSHVVGMFILTKDEPDYFETRQEQHVAFAFASQVAIALANAELFEQTFERTNELGTLLEASQATSLTRDLKEVFSTVAELMFSALEVEDATIMIWDEVNNEMEVQYSGNHLGTEAVVPVGTRYSLRDYPARARALKEREVIVIIDTDDPERLPDFPHELDEMRAAERGARMFVPLVVRDQGIGLIQLEQQSNNEDDLTQAKARLARALGSQVAVAIENARLTKETTTRFEELLTINQLSQSISSTLKLDNMLPIIKAQLLQVTSAEELYLALYDAEEDRMTFPLAVNAQGEEFVIPSRAVTTDEVSYIVRRKHSLSLEDSYFTIDEFRKSMSVTNGEGDIKAYLGVPLRSGDEILGVLAIRNRESSRAFTLNDNRVLTTVASQLGAAIQNARLFERIESARIGLENLVMERTEELEDERDRLDTLYQITSELARTLDMRQLLDRSLGMLSKAVGADDGVILLNDPATDELFARAWLNPYNVTEIDGAMMHPSVGLAKWLIFNEDTFDAVVLVEDLHEHDYWEGDGRATGMRSAMAVMLDNNEDPLGVLVLLSKEPHKFTENHLKLLVPAANQVAASINSADLYQLIKEQAGKMGQLLRTEQEEAQKNSAILESIADGVMLADSTGTIMLFNSAAERILELPREQAIGENVNKVAGLFGESVANWMQVLDEWTETEAYLDSQEDVVTRRIEIDQRIIDAQLSPVYSGDMYLGTVSVFRDITKDVEADRAKTQFIANVSHEFRTPLTPIKGYSDLLLMNAGGHLSEQQINMVGTIKSNVERLTVLVDDVLNIAQLDSGDDPVHFTSVDLNELVENAFRQIATRPKNTDKQLDTSISLAEGLSEIDGDGKKLTQTFLNLIENAFNYTPPNGSIIVKVTDEREEDTVLITIADTGVGIPEAFRDRVWNRFERYDEHAVELDIAGTGLGLSLARELVRRHNGEIWFDSELGIGTSFYVRLPKRQQTYLNSADNRPRSMDTETVAGD